MCSLRISECELWEGSSQTWVNILGPIVSRTRPAGELAKRAAPAPCRSLWATEAVGRSTWRDEVTGICCRYMTRMQNKGSTIFCARCGPRVATERMVAGRTVGFVRAYANCAWQAVGGDWATHQQEVSPRNVHVCHGGDAQRNGAAGLGPRSIGAGPYKSELKALGHGVYGPDQVRHEDGGAFEGLQQQNTGWVGRAGWAGPAAGG